MRYCTLSKYPAIAIILLLLWMFVLLYTLGAMASRHRPHVPRALRCRRNCSASVCDALWMFVCVFMRVVPSCACGQWLW